MAHSLSASKRIRQNARRQERNRARRTALKSASRKTLEVIAGGNVAASESALRSLAARLDRAADRGTIHKNAAARRKSRLAKRVNAMKAAAK